jgi:general secretion pathway protein A
VDDPRKRSLADDPAFIARLSDLDRDLSPMSPEEAAAASRSSNPGIRTRPLLDLFPPNLDLPITSPAPEERVRPPRRELKAARPRKLYPHETFYGLQDRAFGLDVDLRFLYHSAQHDRAVQGALAGLSNGDGVVLIVGEAGMGKSTACHAIVDQLDGRRPTSLVTRATPSAELLLRTLVADFGLSVAGLPGAGSKGVSKDALTIALRTFFDSRASGEDSALIIVDDAHRLPVSVLHQLQVLTDVDGDQPLFQLVLAGEPSLLANLKRRELRPLLRRVGRRSTIGPLAKIEVPGYVVHRLAVAGASPRVEFDDRAFERLHELARGVPRVVNLLCDRALAAGQRGAASIIDKTLVEAGASELELGNGLSRRPALRLAGLVVLLMMLAALGAAGAAFLLHADLSAAVREWQRIPALPAAPRPAIPPLPRPADPPLESTPLLGAAPQP